MALSSSKPLLNDGTLSALQIVTLGALIGMAALLYTSPMSFTQGNAIGRPLTRTSTVAVTSLPTLPPPSTPTVPSRSTLVTGVAVDDGEMPSLPPAPLHWLSTPFLHAAIPVTIVAITAALLHFIHKASHWVKSTSLADEHVAVLAASSGMKTTKNKKVRITYDMKARQAMLRGINTVADTVGVTIGPRGRNVVLEQGGEIFVINDGVSIARAIELPDPLEDAGAQLIKEVAGRTNDKAGDGTTTSSVLARDIIRRGLRAVATGHNPMSIRKGITKVAAFVERRLKEQATPVRGPKDIEFVASIAACNDEEIGRMIAEAVDRVGADGVLSIDDSRSTETWIDVRQGMELDRGYITKEFINNNDRSTVEFENPAILITDHKIDNIAQLVPLMEQLLEASNQRGSPIPLVVIAEDVTPEALPLLVINKVRGVLPSVAIRAPGFGDRRPPLLQDLAIYTNAEYVSKGLGMKLEDATLDMLGTCRKITVRETDMTIIADGRNKEDIQFRVQQLKKDLAQTDSVFDTLRLAERIAKLSGGIAIINVGANTEAELEDRKLRVEDAKNATFAALSDGILPGGGTALLHIAEEIPAFLETIEDPDEYIGVEIVMKAMPEPCRMIARNAGQEGEVIVARLKGKPFNVGYNAMTDTVEDLVEAGVIDPAKVTRNVFLNACSIAEIMLTTQAIVTGVAPKQKDPMEDPYALD